MELDEGYWFNKLNSLGIDPKRKNELNDRKEMKDLVENVKQVTPQEYRNAYTEELLVFLKLIVIV
jgi:hypothetical protein